jgi:hypothetical protein
MPKKTSFRASKRLRKFRTRKTAKNSKLPKLPESCFEPAGKGGWPPISTWINPPSLGNNGLHCVEFPHQMRKFLLNLALGEPLALVQELPYFDDLLKLDLWDPMVGIPTPPKRGCGWLSYAGLSCSYARHREDSHPMCEGAWNYTCT